MELYKDQGCNKLCMSVPATQGCLRLIDGGKLFCKVLNSEVPESILECPRIQNSLIELKEECQTCAFLEADPVSGGEIPLFCSVENCKHYGK